MSVNKVIKMFITKVKMKIKFGKRFGELGEKKLIKLFFNFKINFNPF